MGILSIKNVKKVMKFGSNISRNLNSGILMPSSSSRLSGLLKGKGNRNSVLMPSSSSRLSGLLKGKGNRNIFIMGHQTKKRLHLNPGLQENPQIMQQQQQQSVQKSASEKLSYTKPGEGWAEQYQKLQDYIKNTPQGQRIADARALQSKIDASGGQWQAGYHYDVNNPLSTKPLPESKPQLGQQVGMANPAAVWAQQQGFSSRVIPVPGIPGSEEYGREYLIHGVWQDPWQAFREAQPVPSHQPKPVALPLPSSQRLISQSGVLQPSQQSQQFVSQPSISVLSQQTSKPISSEWM